MSTNSYAKQRNGCFSCLGEAGAILVLSIAAIIMSFKDKLV